MKFIDDLCRRTAIKITQHEMDGWPPACFGTYYQPERPLSTATEHAEKEAAIPNDLVNDG